MFNLYECYRKYNIEHMIAWEAYELDNGLTVKINPSADPHYPFKKGQDFSFISHDVYSKPGNTKESLFIYNVDQATREKYPEVITGLDIKGQPVRVLHQAKVVEVKPLVKVIDLDHDFDFEWLNFTLNGAPLFAELLVYMMKEISEVKKM